MNRNNSNSSVRLVWLLCALCVAVLPLLSRENDPFTQRELYEERLPDFVDDLDAQTNKLLDSAVTKYNAAHCPNTLKRNMRHRKFAFYIYNETAAERVEEHESKVPERITLSYALTKKGLGPLQRWVREEADRKYLVNVTENIYAGVYLLPDRYFTTFSINVDDIFMGPDKVDHFFDQGFAYWQVSRYGKNDRRAIAHGVDGEHSYFGLKASGVFSFADLRSNWIGYQFYKKLFKLKPTLFSLKPDGCVAKERAFSWKNWVDWQWDELWNPSYYKRSVQRKVKSNFERNMELHDYCTTFNYLKERGAYDYAVRRTREYINRNIPRRFGNLFHLGYLCKKNKR